MVLVSSGATTKVTLNEALSGAITDARGKPVKFKPVKDTEPVRYEGKGTDKVTYGFSLGDELVDVSATPTTDLKALRRRSKGFPVDKGEAKKIDEEIEKEEKEKEEQAEEEEEKEETTTEPPTATTLPTSGTSTQTAATRRR